MPVRWAGAVVGPGASALSCGWFKWEICKPTCSCLVWVSLPSSISPFSANGPFYHFLSDHCGLLDHGWRACAQDGVSRVGFDVCRGAISPCVFWIQPTRFSTRYVVYHMPRVATELRDGYRRLESDHGATCRHRYTRRGLVRRSDRKTRKCILRLSFVHLRQRNRRICVNRFIFLLRVSRARTHSHIFVDRNLRKRKSRGGSMEDHHLSSDWKLCSAAGVELR